MEVHLHAWQETHPGGCTAGFQGVIKTLVPERPTGEGVGRVRNPWYLCSIPLVYAAYTILT